MKINENSTQFIEKQKQNQIIDTCKNILQPFYDQWLLSKDQFKEIGRYCAHSDLLQIATPLNHDQIKQKILLYCKLHDIHLNFN